MTKRKGEAEFTTKLQKWIKYNWKHSGPWEVKMSYEPSFNYAKGVKPHQLPNLITTAHDHLCQTYKISDLDQMQKPWDLDVYYQSLPVFCIAWYGSKTFYLIHPSSIINHIESGAKSLKEETAAYLAHTIGTL